MALNVTLTKIQTLLYIYKSPSKQQKTQKKQTKSKKDEEEQEDGELFSNGEESDKDSKKRWEGT